MGLILYLILLAVWGLIIGGLARLALPGPDPMGLGTTTLIGIAASLIAGLIMWAVFGDATGGGFIVSLLVAVGIVYLIRRSRGQSLWSTRRRPDSNPYRF
jgi:uncharacterized membrane protein YeaQ/YmgE (transglycosylase-associated protein family)